MGGLKLDDALCIFERLYNTPCYVEHGADQASNRNSSNDIIGICHAELMYL